MLTLKVLGPGCANCKKLEAVAREAASGSGIEVQVLKASAMKDIMAYDLIATPGLVINEKLVAAGRIPSAAEVANWLTQTTVAA